MEISTAINMIHYYLKKYNLHQYDAEINNRMLRRLAQCCYPWKEKRGLIRLSKTFVVYNDPLFVEKIILHEIAHALVGPGHHHDDVWKAMAISIGAEPNAICENAFVPGKWRATCGSCGRSHYKYRKPKKLNAWYCNWCGCKPESRLTFEENILTAKS